MNLKDFIKFDWEIYENYILEIEDNNFSLYYRSYSKNVYIRKIIYLLNSRRGEIEYALSNGEVKLFEKILSHTKGENTETYISSILARTNNADKINDFNTRVKSLIPKYIKMFTTAKDYSIKNTTIYFIVRFFIINNYKENKILADNVLDLLTKEKPNKYTLSLCLELVKTIQNLNFYNNNEIVECIIKVIKECYLLKYKDVQFTETIEELLDLCINLVSNNDKEKYNEFLCIVLKNNFEDFTFTKRQEKLEKLIEIMKSNKESVNEINIYKKHLAKAKKDALKHPSTITIPFDEELNKEIKAYEERIVSRMNYRSNIYILYNMLDELDMITKADLENIINAKNESSIFLSLFKTKVLDKDGRLIVSGSPHDQEQMFLSKAYSAFTYLMQFKINPYLEAFTYYINVDTEVSECLEEVFTTNIICDPSRAEYLIRIFELFLEGDYDLTCRNIISEFEAGLRYFFQNEMISTLKFAGNKQIHVDLNDMLKNTPDNIYRNKLSEYMTDDFLFLIEYLLITNPGGNIRNDALHGNIHPDDFESNIVIYTILKIFHVYYGFYCNSNID